MGVRVGSHNTSVSSKLLWKSLRKSTFYTQLELIHRGNSWPNYFTSACSVMLFSDLHTFFFFKLSRIPPNVSQQTLMCEKCQKTSLRWTGTDKQPVPGWKIEPPHGGWWILFTVVWLTLLRGYKLLLEQNRIPTQAWGIQPGTLSVSGLDTAVWVPIASQTGT